MWIGGFQGVQSPPWPSPFTTARLALHGDAPRAPISAPMRSSAHLSGAEMGASIGKSHGGRITGSNVLPSYEDTEAPIATSSAKPTHPSTIRASWR